MHTTQQAGQQCGFGDCEGRRVFAEIGSGGLPDALRLPATMNFILNPDLEDAEEEESSEEESSDDG